MSDAYVPMPDTHHPFYEDAAETVRGHLGHNRWDIRVAVAPRFNARWWTEAQERSVEAITPTHLTLAIKKVVGPAPFTGDARYQEGFYEWLAAVDDLGRHVAGPASLRIEERVA